MVSYSEINNPELVIIIPNPVKRIESIARKNWQMLSECRLYLNEKGKTVQLVHSCIEDACQMADTLDEVKANLEEEISKSHNEAVKRRLKTFIKDYL